MSARPSAPDGDGLTYAELCAGYGGLGMGVQEILGGRVAWLAEYDDDPARVMAHHHPGVENYRDVTSIDWYSVPRVNVLTAGFPCQPFSHAGKRLGANDERHLWPYIADGIGIMRPDLVVLENVRGLMSGQGEPDTDQIVALAERINHIDRALKVIERRRRKAIREQATAYVQRHTDDSHRLVVERRATMARAVRARRELARAIAAVLGRLAELGYDAQWYGLRAADVGAPHGRWRVFIFAWPVGAIDDPEWIIYRAAAARDAGRGRGVEALQSHGSGAASGDGSGVPDESDRHALRSGPVRAGSDGLTLLPTPAVNDMGRAYTPDEWDDWTAKMKAAHGNGNGHGKSLEIEAQRLLPTPRTSDSNGAGHHGTGGPDLRTVAAERLFPTPRASDGEKGGPNQRGSSGDLMLPSAVQGLLPTPRATRGGSSTETTERLLPTPTVMDHKASGGGYNGQTNVTLTDATVRNEQDWREYGPAVRRWEALTRPAPSPTELGAKGQPRLSPAFTEWMMGLPLGHITDPAIWDGMTDGKGKQLTGDRLASASRNAQLKLAGNGVVPQQCAAATEAFVADVWAETQRAAS